MVGIDGLRGVDPSEIVHHRASVHVMSCQEDPAAIVLRDSLFLGRARRVAAVDALDRVQTQHVSVECSGIRRVRHEHEQIDQRLSTQSSTCGTSRLFHCRRADWLTASLAARAPYFTELLTARPGKRGWRGLVYHQ